ARQTGFLRATDRRATPTSVRNAWRHPCRLGLEFAIRLTKGPTTMKTMHVAIIALALGTSGAFLQAQEPKRLQGFSVLLLLGEMQGTAQPENISAPARKALT